MKNFYLISSVFIALTLLFSAAAPVQAGTTKTGNRKKVAPSTEADGYNPDADPLPEWLLLPEAIDENKLEFKGTQNEQQTIRYTDGSDKWVIQTKGDGKSITYKYYENNKLQFGAKTSAAYGTVSIYDSKGKRLKKVSAEDFFNETVSISSLKDTGVIIRLAAASKNTPCALGKVRKNNRCVEPNYNKVRKNKQLSTRQLNKLARKAGFKGQGRKLAVAVAKAESDGRIGNVLCNTDNPYNPRYKFDRGVKACQSDRVSADRGLWQINNRWHKNVSNKCAFQPRCNARAAYRISNGGRDWTPWSTFTNRSYERYI